MMKTLAYIEEKTHNTATVHRNLGRKIKASVAY